jgi:hypothetical protein
MLENKTTALAVPKQPFSQWYLEAQGIEENNNSSMNNMSVTVLDGQ